MAHVDQTFRFKFDVNKSGFKWKHASFNLNFALVTFSIYVSLSLLLLHLFLSFSILLRQLYSNNYKPKVDLKTNKKKLSET